MQKNTGCNHYRFAIKFIPLGELPYSAKSFYVDWIFKLEIKNVTTSTVSLFLCVEF